MENILGRFPHWSDHGKNASYANQLNGKHLTLLEYYQTILTTSMKNTINLLKKVRCFLHSQI